MNLKSERIPVTDAHEAVEMFFERRWSDGLPIVPPTPEKVEQMISWAGREPQEQVGPVPPKMGIATIEKIAVNAVMAGCLPQHFPVVLAGVEAALDPRHKLAGTQVTTHMCEPLLIVNGPIAKQLGFNSSEGVFGHGYRANAVVGRALVLTLWNLGGSVPGEMDKSCFSHPGSWSFCVAENDEASPWEPFHVSRGLKPGSSAVTVFSCEPPHSVSSYGTIEEELNITANCMVTPGSNNFYFMGEILVVINTGSAKRLGDGGWSKERVKEYLWEKTKRPLGLLRKTMPITFSMSSQLLGARSQGPDDAPVPLVEKPDDIHVIVAGGNYFNAICPGWGCHGGLAVTKEIKSSYAT